MQKRRYNRHRFSKLLMLQLAGLADSLAASFGGAAWGALSRSMQAALRHEAHALLDLLAEVQHQCKRTLRISIAKAELKPELMSLQLGRVSCTCGMHMS